MTERDSDDSLASRRRLLARQMVLILPGFGRWASTIREFETPYGKAGIRQLEVLYLLRHGLLDEAELSATGLANHLQIQRSAVTRVLAKLENGGYLVRTTDPRDGRAQQITITATGRLLSDYVEQQFFDEMMGAMGDIVVHDIACMERAIDLLSRVSVKLGVRGATKRIAHLTSG